MKLSADGKSPHFSPLVTHATVLRDGVKVLNVRDVDTDLGIATIYTPSGPDGTLEPEEVAGNFEVVFTMKAVFEYGAALNHNRTAHWLHSCGKRKGDLGDLSVQVGCHIEEFVEFLEQLSDLTVQQKADILGLGDLAHEFKKEGKLVSFKNEAAALDALCDAEVTGNGVAYLAGWNKPRADSKVLEANEAKLVNGRPVLLEGGKIGKPEGWSPADLSDCV